MFNLIWIHLLKKVKRQCNNKSKENIDLYDFAILYDDLIDYIMLQWLSPSSHASPIPLNNKSSQVNPM